MFGMKRREFITLLGGAAAAWPLAARAQQSAMPVVGYLNPGSASARREHVAAFRRGLNELGFVEGRNVAIEYRWAEDQYDRLPEMVADLANRRVAVIVASGGTPAARIAKGLTTTIPIVFSTSVDPVQIGLVASLNRPSGNLTGITDMVVDLGGKQVGLLHELLPRAVRSSLLVNPGGAVAEPTITEAQTAVSTIGGQLEVLHARTNRDIDAVFASLAQKRADALLVSSNVLFTDRRVQIVTLATRYAVPTIYSRREFAETGGLMSYGSSITDRERQVGVYTGRILRGERAAELPILRASKFEFVINLQTARTLGIEVPNSIQLVADEVIE